MCVYKFAQICVLSVFYRSSDQAQEPFLQFGLWWTCLLSLIFVSSGGSKKCFCTNVGLLTRSMSHLDPYTDPERSETIKYDVK